MVNPSGAFDVSIMYEEENIYDDNVKSILKNLLNLFNGYHYNIYVNRIDCTRFRVPIISPAYPKSLFALRLQYLYLFVLHYPVVANLRSDRNLMLYKDFVDQLESLKAEVEDGENHQYMSTILRLIHITELLAAVMKYEKIPWYRCMRCGTESGQATWMRNPIIKCLSEVKVVAVNVVAQYVGYPSRCYCKTKLFHLPQDQEYEA